MMYIRYPVKNVTQGNNNSDTSNTCRTNCLDPYCDDNIIDTTEECDEGTNNSDTSRYLSPKLS